MPHILALLYVKCLVICPRTRHAPQTFLCMLAKRSQAWWQNKSRLVLLPVARPQFVAVVCFAICGSRVFRSNCEPNGIC